MKMRREPTQKNNRTTTTTIPIWEECEKENSICQSILMWHKKQERGSCAHFTWLLSNILHLCQSIYNIGMEVYCAFDTRDGLSVCDLYFLRFMYWMDLRYRYTCTIISIEHHNGIARYVIEHRKRIISFRGKQQMYKSVYILIALNKYFMRTIGLATPTIFHIPHAIACVYFMHIHNIHTAVGMIPYMSYTWRYLPKIGLN